MSLERSMGRKESVASRPESVDNIPERERTSWRRGLLAHIAALVISAASVYQEKPAEAAEVKSGMTWEEGFDTLKDEVLHSKREQAAYAILRKDGHIEWTASQQGEETRVRVQSFPVLRALEKDVASGSFESLCSFHTHPILSAQAINIITPEEARKSQSAEKVTLSIPPSVVDITDFEEIETSKITFGLTSAAERRGGYMVHVVLDPSRVWRYRFAHDEDYKKNPEVWKEISEQRETVADWEAYIKRTVNNLPESALDAFKTHLTEDYLLSFTDYERERGKKYKTRDIINAKRRMITHVLLDGQNRNVMEAFLSGDRMAQTLHESLTALRQKRVGEISRLNDFLYDEWVPTSKEREPSQSQYQTLQEKYLRNFTVIESFAHDEARDPLKVCRWPESKTNKTN